MQAESEDISMSDGDQDHPIVISQEHPKPAKLDISFVFSQYNTLEHDESDK